MNVSGKPIRPIFQGQEVRDISNSVESTGTFRVARPAASDVSSCWVFWVWYVKMPLIKLAKFSTFLFLFWVYASTFIYPHRKEKLYFLYARWKCVLSCIIYCTGFCRFWFSWTFRASERSGVVAVDEPLQGAAKGPVDHSRNHASSYVFPVSCVLFRL
jgi:hypothetical protein